MKNLVMAVVILGAGWFYFSSQKSTTVPSDMQVQSTNVDSGGLEPEIEYPFSINNVTVVEDVLKIDDGDPQTDDSSFDVTWEYRATNEPSNAYISFSVIDENENIVSSGLKGAGSAKSYLSGSATLKLTSLCSTVPVEGCITGDDFNPSSQYRLRVSGANCLDSEINPGYCSESDREPIEPAYSNWFKLSVE